MTQTTLKTQDHHRFSLVSLGCARSLNDSEVMANKLQKIGMDLVPEGSGETVTLLNTCAFIEAAIQETEDNIRQLLKRKADGHLKHLVVVGCYPSRYKPQELKDKFPDVDLWLTTREEDKIQAEVSKLIFREKFQPSTRPYVKLTPTHYSYLKISEGCNNWCTFCTIPKIRGVHTSKSIETVLTEAKIQLAMGAKELILIAEDTTAWGEDIYGKPSFPILLAELAKLPVDWIRVMYVFPSRVDDELIRVIKNTPNICNYMDMPIQHVSSDMLAAMNRRHDRDFLQKIVRDMKQEIPDLALRTTFIIGFPGETEAHIDELIDFIETDPFYQLGCFTYSEEKMTRSARMDAKVPIEIAKKRLARVMKRQHTLLKATNQTMIGQTIPLLYEGNGIARGFFQAPEVDNIVLISSKTPITEGTFFNGKIVGLDGYDLKAEAV